MDRQEWLEWRRGGIGASDAPIVVGASKWRTPHELYLEKVFGCEDTEPNAAMQRGIDLEPVVRSLLEDRHRILLKTANVDKGEVWRASLDAVTFDGSVVFEIKCPGSKDHEAAKKGKVPTHYFPQLQHIMLVTGLSRIIYASYRDESLIELEILRDDAYIKSLKEKELAFWDCVKNQRWP